MRYTALFFLAILFCSCKSYIYVVRHAEKATPMGNNTDVSLTPAGEERASALLDSLKNMKIRVVYSTNTIRTRSTAKPTADYFQLHIQTYPNMPDSNFISTLRHLHKNALVVGHSNTVDDIVNRVCGAKLIAGDLKDSDYDNLFVIVMKRKKAVLLKRKYGEVYK